MKKIQILFVAIVAVMFSAIFTSCNEKPDECKTSDVSWFDGSFIGKEGNLKSLAIGATRTYTYLIGENEGGPTFPAPSPNPYSPYKLLKENLFFKNSEPWLFWKDYTNNPETFGMNGVYSNFSPNRQSRMTCEVKNSDGKSTHLGISDFLPNANLFPLTINNQRIGAIGRFNADGIKNIPNAAFTGLTITIDQMAQVDVFATSITSGPTTVAGVPAWPTWQYVGNATSQTFVITAEQLAATGDVTFYDGVELNILPTATITVSVQIAGITVTQTVAGPAIGEGINLVFETDNAGWYDSNNATINENNLLVKPKVVTFE